VRYKVALRPQSRGRPKGTSHSEVAVLQHRVAKTGITVRDCVVTMPGPAGRRSQPIQTEAGAREVLACSPAASLEKEATPLAAHDILRRRGTAASECCKGSHGAQATARRIGRQGVGWNVPGSGPKPSIFDHGTEGLSWRVWPNLRRTICRNYSAARSHGWRMQPGLLAAASSCERHGATSSSGARY
jgi:hypothetical protein